MTHDTLHMTQIMNAALLEEYRAVRQRAGLIDWSSWGLIEVLGADRVAFLHGLLTNDIKQMTPGIGCQAALVTANAKLLAEMIVLADTQAHWLIVPRSRIAVVLQTLDRYLITEDVRFSDHSSTHTLYAMQGPASAAVLREALGAELPASGLTHQMVEVAGVAVGLIAHSITGESGAMVSVIAENAAWLEDQLVKAGAVPVGSEALNVLRIEAGIPWYSVDMDESHLLPETGLERTHVSDTKGCYVGQEVIARLKTYGSTSRKLTGLVCEGRDVPQANDSIEKNGETLGAITSACWSPALEAPIALGYVKRPWYEAGTVVEVKRTDGRCPAKLVRPPFL